MRARSYQAAEPGRMAQRSSLPIMYHLLFRLARLIGAQPTTRRQIRWAMLAREVRALRLRP
jgi:hypothetical protein